MIPLKSRRRKRFLSPPFVESCLREVDCKRTTPFISKGIYGNREAILQKLRFDQSRTARSHWIFVRDL